MSTIIDDNRGNSHFGSRNRSSDARITVDFDAGDANGVALDVAASPDGVSERAVIKLGDFTIGQDIAKNGTKNFALQDGSGNTLVTWVAGNISGAQLSPTKYVPLSGNTPLNLVGANVTGAEIVVIDLTAVLAGGGTLNLPTAAQIFASIPGAIVGQSYDLRIINSSSGAFAWTVTTNTGITLNGTPTINQNTWRAYIVTIVSATAVTFQAIGTGTQS